MNFTELAVHAFFSKYRVISRFCLGVVSVLALVAVDTFPASAQQTWFLFNPANFDCDRALRSVSVQVYSLNGASPHKHPTARISCGYRSERLAIHVRVLRNPDLIKTGRPVSLSGNAMSTTMPVDLPNQTFGTGDLRFLHQHVFLINYHME